MVSRFSLALAAMLLGGAALSACGEETTSTPQGGSAPGGQGGTVAGGSGGTAGRGGTGAGGGVGATGGTGGSAGLGGQGGTGGSAGLGGAGGSSGGGGGGGGGGSGGSGGSGGAAGSGGGGGSGGSGGGSSDEAFIVSQGDPGVVLLRGTIVTMVQPPFEGEVLIDGRLLACVAPSCASEAAAANASVVETNGIVMPGMLDTHNHILYNIFDETDWSPSQIYDNHNQWGTEARYGAMVDCKQYLNGEGTSTVDVGCEMNKYGELKGLVAGTTSISGAASPPSNRACYRTVARTIDQTANELCGATPPQSCPDAIQVHSIYPSADAADGVCENFSDGDTDAYFIHLGEGVDQTAYDEYLDLWLLTTEPDPGWGCLWDPRTTFVHATAFGEDEFFEMGAYGMGISWSPASNVFLYGGGTDLSMTTDIPTALSYGVDVVLSPDWSLGGSQNLLDELRFADRVDDTEWGNQLTPEMLVEMVTTAAARRLAVDDVLGSLVVGKLADVVVLGGDRLAPFDAILAATPAEVRLVFVDGEARYGDHQLEALGPTDPGCEPFDACGEAKFVCVAVPEIAANDPQKFTQTLSEIEAAISAELLAYDDLNLTQWDFAPITPVVRCP